MGVWPPFSIISPPKVDRQGDMRSVTVSSLDRLAGADYDMLIQFLRVNELYVVKSRGKKKKAAPKYPVGPTATTQFACQYWRHFSLGTPPKLVPYRSGVPATKLLV